MRNLCLPRFLLLVAGPIALLAPACLESSPGGSQAPTPAQSGKAASGTPTPPAGQPGSSVAAAAVASPFSKCRDAPLESPADLPDAGVVMSNAAPVGDAGTSDRIVPVERTLAENRGKFRCCFDAGGPYPPHQEVKITLVLDLKASGEVRSVNFDRTETDTTSDAVESCIADIARSLTYAESGHGMDTPKYRHRFRFKTHG